MQGSWFLYPHIDDTNKTIAYYAFDTFEQKNIFESMLKLNGIGPKTAFHIASMDPDILKNAIATVDLKTITAIPGIGPKTAKRLMVELKDTRGKDDFDKLTVDPSLLKSILTTLKPLGYDSSAIKNSLQSYPDTVTKATLPAAIQWIVRHLSQ